MYSLVIFLVLIASATMACLGIKGGQRTSDSASDEVFPMFFSKSIAGVSTLLIIAHHLSGSPIFDDIPMAGIYRNIGMWCVTIFFFISGYGTASGFQRISYRRSFWKRKFETIIIRFIFAYLIFLFVRIVFGNYSFKKFLEGIGKGTTTVLYSWYIYALILMYLFFAMSFSEGRIHWGRFLFWGVAYFVVFCLLLHFPTHWYGSYPAFYAGVFLQSNRKIQGWLLKHRHILIPPLLMLFAVCFYVQMISSPFGFRLLCGYCGVFALSVLFYLFGGMLFVRQKWLLIVNNYGLEIYLYHGMVLEALEKISAHVSLSPYSYICIAEVCSLIFGVITKRLGDIILKLFRKF